MKRFAAITSLLFLAACSRTPSGTYAALGKDGEVARQRDGQPKLTISLGNGTAVLRAADGDDEMAQYKLVDGTLYVTEPGTSETMSLKVQGDLLVGTGKFKELSFEKL